MGHAQNMPWKGHILGFFGPYSEPICPERGIIWGSLEPILGSKFQLTHLALKAFLGLVGADFKAHILNLFFMWSPSGVAWTKRSEMACWVSAETMCHPRLFSLFAPNVELLCKGVRNPYKVSLCCSLLCEAVKQLEQRGWLMTLRGIVVVLGRRWSSFCSFRLYNVVPQLPAPLCNRF